MTHRASGHSVYLATGASLRLPEKPLGDGAEGAVFKASGHRSIAVKLYHADQLGRKAGTLETKIGAMLENPPQDPTANQGHVSLAWPLEKVHDADKHFVGYTMPLIDKQYAVALHMVENPSDRRRSRKAPEWLSGFGWNYLLGVAVNLASATQSLHDRKYVIGDFRETNVLVRKNALVTMIDCDSFQVPNGSAKPFLSEVHRPEYTAPEMLTADFGKVVRTIESDRFPLAVHIYQLLMEGKHPFDGKWQRHGDKPSRAQLALRGLFVQASKGSLLPPDGSPPFDIVPNDVQSLFGRAFVDGAKDPAARPSGLEWYEQLRALSTTLRQCSKERGRHQYPGHLGKRCPWCELERVTYVATPAATGQIALPSPQIPRRPTRIQRRLNPRGPSPQAYQQTRVGGLPVQPIPQPPQPAPRIDRVAAMQTQDSRILTVGAVVAVTLVIPFLVGQWLWRDHLATHALHLPSPHPRLAGIDFVPQVVFGLGITAIMVGLLLLRPPWALRRVPRLLGAAILVGAGAVAPSASTLIARKYVTAELRRYDTGPVAPSALGGSCGHYSTSAPNHKGVVRRTLVYPSGSNNDFGFGPLSGCNHLALFRAWRKVWQVKAPAKSWFDSVYAFGRIVVAREDVYLAPNILVGFDGNTGRTRWHWQCGDGDYAYLTNDEYHGYDPGHQEREARWVQVECSYGVVRIDPLTGRRMRT